MSNVVSSSKPVGGGSPSAGKDKPSTEQEVPKHWLRQVWDFVGPIVILLAILCAARSSIYDWNDVPSGSMLPTILEGDRVLVNKLAYDLKVPFTTWHIAEWGGPQRGDIVVFFSPEPEGTRLIKRCVGIPGDLLEVRDDQIYINGVAQPWAPFNPNVLQYISPSEYNMPYFTETIGAHRHLVRLTGQPGSRRYFPPTRIPPGKYFMMGDNRDNSRDSRYFQTKGSKYDGEPGEAIFADRSQIVGKASRIAFSLNYKNHWLPRWKRFFEALP